ncbi:collagen alpha-2(I) chain-like isoform X1 [Rhea pennata]|uniref:collagen alpha-2(I) chain-like isoform X1 n=1 Tax=Rhea pennata TaxID=8795 RepID=UPI002E271164
MRRTGRSPSGPGSPGCPDLLRHVGGPRSPLSPLFLSFFEEECRAIANRLRLAAAAAGGPGLSPGPGGEGAPWLEAGPVISTLLPGNGVAGAGAPGPAAAPRGLPRPAGASTGAEPPRAAEGPGAPGSRLPALPAAAVEAGGPGRPSRRLSTAIPVAASRSRLRLPGKVASPKRFCLGSAPRQLARDATRRPKADGGSEGRQAAARAAPGAREQHGCGDAAAAEQPAGARLCQELERVQSELERVKSELAARVAQCEAYRRTISRLRAQLRAAGAWPQGAPGDGTGVSGRD